MSEARKLDEFKKRLGMDLVDPDTAAELAKVSRSTIDRAKKSGALKSYKIGNKVLIDLKDLKTWILQQQVVDHG